VPRNDTAVPGGADSSALEGVATPLVRGNRMLRSAARGGTRRVRAGTRRAEANVAPGRQEGDFVRSRSAAALLVAFGFSAHPASAALLVYEPFDYASGFLLQGVPPSGLNLTGTYTAPVGPFQQLQAGAPGLGYGALPGLPSPGGNRLTQANGVVAGSASVAVDADVYTGPDTTIFWSVLMTLDDSNNGNRHAYVNLTDTTTGDQIGFGESVVGSGAIRIDADTAATGRLVAAGFDDAFADGHTVLLVGRYLNASALDGDRLDLLVYDTADSEALSPVFDLADPAAELAFSLTGLDVDLAIIDSITFTIRGTNDNYIDELRIGTTYADVVPEPGTALLLAAGLCGLAAAGGRRAA
jgi:hypothetical protein